MTAWQLIRLIYSTRWASGLTLPNYTPAGWFECDVFELTKAGYFREYEVKVTRADFFADQTKKRPDRWKWKNGVRVDTPGDRKHDLLAARSAAGPTRFWYVTPKGLVRPDELPEWAGLIEAVPQTPHRAGGRLFETEVRPAPQLHRQKLPAAAGEHARGVCYYRYHHELAKRRV